MSRSRRASMALAVMLALLVSTAQPAAAADVGLEIASRHATTGELTTDTVNRIEISSESLGTIIGTVDIEAYRKIGGS